MDSDSRLIYAPGCVMWRGMSFNRECSQLSQGSKRLLLYFLFRRKKIQTPFWWESVLGMRKCVFGLCFHFHKTLGLYFQLEDPREMKNYQDSSSFDVSSETASTYLVFFQQEIWANFSNLYAIGDGRNLRKHQALFKGNFICIWGGTLFHGERPTCVKDI